MLESFVARRNWHDTCISCYARRRGHTYECEVVVRHKGLVVGRQDERFASPEAFEGWLGGTTEAGVERIEAIAQAARRAYDLKMAAMEGEKAANATIGR